jgi:hypothetical protein
MSIIAKKTTFSIQRATFTDINDEQLHFVEQSKEEDGDLSTDEDVNIRILFIS